MISGDTGLCFSVLSTPTFAKIEQKVFLFCLGIPLPNSFLLVMMKLGSNSYLLLLVITEEDKEKEKLAAKVSLAAAKLAGKDSAVVAVLSEVHVVKKKKEWHRKLFLVDTMFCFTTSGLW